MKHHSNPRRLCGLPAPLLLSLSLAACGGGGGDAGSTGTPPPAGGPSTAQRVAAASSTAVSSSNACAPVQPFYWEIGDSVSSLGSGSVAAAGGAPVYTSSSSMNIASASKWLYGAYVAQRRAGVLTASDVKYLTFTSGYSNFSTCLQGQSVQGCVNYQTNGVYSAATDGKFYYDGGHMQQHAVQEMGLGGLFNAGLATELQSRLGSDIGLSYSQPQLAGGVVSTGADYARFLRKLLNRQLAMASLLGTQPVCTNPNTCATALYTPILNNLSWHYSIGHWVEDDPSSGDGAFSSPGAFGFYPWLDASKTWYGLLVRFDATSGAANASAACGRLIRKAWVSGVAQ